MDRSNKDRKCINLLKDDALVFDHGDVLIRLGNGPDSIVFVHSEKLKQSPVFEAMFSKEWNFGKQKDPGTGEFLWEFDLMFDRETQLAPLVRKVSINRSFLTSLIKITVSISHAMSPTTNL